MSSRPPVRPRPSPRPSSPPPPEQGFWARWWTGWWARPLNRVRLIAPLAILLIYILFMRD